MAPSHARSQARPLTLVDEPSLDKECPLCEQPISRERLQEIQERLRADQAQQAKDLEKQLRSEFQAAREKERLQHEDEITRATANLKSQLEAAHVDATEREAKARVDARAEVEAEKEAAVATAREATEQLAKIQSEVEEREANARKAAREEALSEVTERISTTESERDRLNTENASLTQRISALETGQDEAVAEAVAKNSREVREALAVDHQGVLAKKEADAFAEKQKLQKTVDDLKRQLEKKTSDELGEGAEVDLFNTLLADFQGDKIERIKKGEAGADIRHTVISDGQKCGSILYDSKNRKQWRTQYAAKLRSDQIADKADHAILATRAFPAKTSQLCIQEGVILANPARVAPIVQILRASMIEVHRLRISAEERQMKTKAIYDFITSPRFTKYMERLEQIASGLADLDSKEKKSHDRVWQDRGVLTQALSKATADLNVQVNSILHS